jgi:hypothetical protein
MKPEHEARRKIIREWMSLPKDKRQTEEQAKPFAKKAMERIPSSGDPYRQIMRWLLPRIEVDRSFTSFQCLSLPKIRFCNNGDEVRQGQRAHSLRNNSPRPQPLQVRAGDQP